MAWVVAAVVGAVVGSQVYSADQQRKAIHGQQDAMRASQEEDARKTAEAETGAQVAANAKLADTKRRRRASALSLGDPTGLGSVLGGSSPSLLSAGGPAPAAKAYAGSGSTALGAGGLNSFTGSGMKSTPTAPTRANSL